MMRTPLLVVLALSVAGALPAAQSTRFHVTQEIGSGVGGFGPGLGEGDSFGRSVAAIGDLDGDGIDDVAVGAYGDDDGGDARGAVWIVFLNAEGSVKSRQKISSTQGGFTGTLEDGSFFGLELAFLGDLSGDSSPELAVGTDLDIVFILELNSDGTVASHAEIDSPAPDYDPSQFGSSLANLGDVDGDGVDDLAIGDLGIIDHITNDPGSVYVYFLNADASVKGFQRIDHQQGGLGLAQPSQGLGATVGDLGDLDRDGVRDMVVSDGTQLWMLFLNANGTVKAQQVISESEGGDVGALFSFAAGSYADAARSAGDLDGDGIQDLIVGDRLNDETGSNRGMVWLLFLNVNGTVKSHERIHGALAAFNGSLDAGDQFGGDVTLMGDVDGDGLVEIAVGAPSNDAPFATDSGAFWLLSLGRGKVRRSVDLPGPGGTVIFQRSERTRYGSYVDRSGKRQHYVVTKSR